MPETALAMKKQLNKQQGGTIESGTGDWIERNVGGSEEERDQRNEDCVGESRKTVYRGSAGVEEISRTF